MENVVLLPEWHEQSAVQLTWPHAETDWAPLLDKVISCFVEIATEVAKRELLIVVCQDKDEVLHYLRDIPTSRLRICETSLNDTWARDHGGISVLKDGKPVVYDFRFNGWGLKFPACYDNLITRSLFSQHVFAKDVTYQNMLQFALEGGSLESDGQGTLLTTSQCLLSPNRNGHLDRAGVEHELKLMFGLKKILWLDYGYLAGDDTDSHIDTLARLCSPTTIAYVKCTDKHDEHYDELMQMEQQLRSFTTIEGKPYTLIALPMADAMYDEDGQRLPATYANYLIINGAVLLPVYNSPKDEVAINALSKAFSQYEIVPIDCSTLVWQHGSLHCVTMQYPKNFIA
jgi:agmatine/peptidylarginine deiminase